MADKTVRELELIIQRLNSQIESKNEQIAELNAYIQQATDSTQELIRNFRAFCIKVLESELAYGEISSRDIERMSLNELLDRAQKMLKENQEKARSIYDVFKTSLSLKNEEIRFLNEQVAELKTKLTKIDQNKHDPYNEPEEMKRTAAYMLDTDSSVDQLRQTVSTSTVVEDNERLVEFNGSVEKDAVETAAKASLFVQDIKDITSQMKDIHWEIIELIVSNGISEMSRAREMICRNIKDEGEPVGTDKASRLIRQLVRMTVFTQLKISTGMRWFTVLKLTSVGEKLYTERFNKKPVETDYDKVVREHDNATHGYTIMDTAQILRDTGRYNSVSTSRKGNMVKLSDGRCSIPDIVCCSKHNVEYYEVECGNHHQSDFNDKCDKLRGFTSQLFFVTPNREVADTKIKPQIEAWIKKSGRETLLKRGITVFLTSISDLAAGRWTFMFDMKSDKPVFIPAPSKKPEE